MFAVWQRASRWVTTLHLALGAAGLLLAAGAAAAGGPPWGVPSGQLPPWERPGFHGYNETIRPTQPPPPIVKAVPQKYIITITMLPQRVPEDQSNTVLLMAHLPEDARVWFDDEPTSSTGKVRRYKSPPLEPGKSYHYTVRIVWSEDGKWVSQTTRVPLRAGEIHCIYLTPAGADRQARIAANLAKLSPEDRKLAEAQKVCPVQEDNPLGAMGVPVKVTIKGQPVFLCCKGCRDEALANPDKTLARVKELKTRNGRQ